MSSLLYEWRFLLKALDDSPLYVAYAFDMKGSGFSEKPRQNKRDGYRLDDFVEVTEGFLDAQQLRQSVLVGRSSGAAVALAFAATHPDRVVRLVLVSPAVYTTPRPLLVKLLRLPGLGNVVSRGMARPRELDRWLGGTRSNLYITMHDPDRITQELARQYAMPLMDPGMAYAYLQTARQFDTGVLPSLLTRITMPTCIIWGEEDHITPPRFARRLARDLPNAHLTMIPRAGHACAEDQPDAVNEAILSFLAS